MGKKSVEVLVFEAPKFGEEKDEDESFTYGSNDGRGKIAIGRDEDYVEGNVGDCSSYVYF